MVTKLLAVIALFFVSASAQLFGGLRNFPQIHGGQRLRLNPQVIRLPDQLRNVLERERACCRAATPECLACAAGQDPEEFCETEGRRIPGCEAIVKKAREAKRNNAIDGVLTKVIEKAAEAAGGDKAKDFADQYLERHPGVARQNLANLTSEAFGAIENLKKPQQSTSETQTGHRSKTHHRPAANHGRHRPSHSPPYDKSDLSDEETRTAPDGGRYTKKEFLDFFGGVDQWNAAEDDDSDDADAGLNKSPFDYHNPWFIAAGALIVTAISSGIAMGALCHARLNRSPREPLLSTLLHEMEPRGGATPVAD